MCSWKQEAICCEQSVYLAPWLVSIPGISPEVGTVSALTALQTSHHSYFLAAVPHTLFPWLCPQLVFKVLTDHLGAMRI